MLIDSNVFMYAAGAPHPNKAPSVAFLQRVASGALDGIHRLVLKRSAGDVGSLTATRSRNPDETVTVTVTVDGHGPRPTIDR